MTGLILTVLYAISWLCTCGLIKLFTLILGQTFSWGISTVVWLGLCIVILAKSIYDAGREVK